MEKVSYICQSCDMLMKKDDDFGSNRDYSKNREYCVFCYKKGCFTHPSRTLEEQIQINMQMGMSKLKMSKEEAQKQAQQITPTLKRWKS